MVELHELERVAPLSTKSGPCFSPETFEHFLYPFEGTFYLCQNLLFSGSRNRNRFSPFCWRPVANACLLIAGYFLVIKENRLKNWDAFPEPRPHLGKVQFKDSGAVYFDVSSTSCLKMARAESGSCCLLILV
jgi:hypothetical protein